MSGLPGRRTSPDEVADLIFSVFHNSGARQRPTRVPHIAELFLPNENRVRVGYVSVNPATGETVIKSGYRNPYDK